MEFTAPDVTRAFLTAAVQRCSDAFVCNVD